LFEGKLDTQYIESDLRQVFKIARKKLRPKTKRPVLQQPQPPPSKVHLVKPATPIKQTKLPKLTQKQIDSKIEQDLLLLRNGQ
jgi:hypothetical protein